MLAYSNKLLAFSCLVFDTIKISKINVEIDVKTFGQFGQG